ncbi:hypothetical protein [Sphingomonas sp.]|uniref:hypothetical protein n=1 Tax=Sphingomonas sp. TaxID=28214 RepID=UPI0031D85932
MLFPRLAVAMLAMSSILGAPAIASIETGKILFLHRPNPPGGSADPAIVTHLEEMGYKVTSSDGLTNVPDPCGFDLVVMSSTVQSNRFTADRAAIARWRDMGVPLLTWENDLLDDLRLTGRRIGSDFGEAETGHYAWVVRASHPMAGGVPAGMTTWTQARQPAGWGKPGLGADIVMVRPGEPDQAMLFGYETGSTMDYDFVAPARRVFIGLENNTFGAMTEDGRHMFDGAIRWAAGGTRSCRHAHGS